MFRPQCDASYAPSLGLSVLLLSGAEVCGWSLGGQKSRHNLSPLREPPVSLRKKDKCTGNHVEVTLTIKLCYDQQLELGIPWETDTHLGPSEAYPLHWGPQSAWCLVWRSSTWGEEGEPVCLHDPWVLGPILLCFLFSSRTWKVPWKSKWLSLS